jgi:predicted RNase H-like HicB family nuclease
MSTVMKIRVELEFDPEANSWSAVCPELRGCVSAGTTREEAIANVKEAIALYLEPTAPPTPGSEQVLVEV